MQAQEKSRSSIIDEVSCERRVCRVTLATSADNSADNGADKNQKNEPPR
jgi:hypothetical protein